MLVYKNNLFSIYFGDARDKIFKEDFVNLQKKNICDMQQFVNLKKNIEFDNLVFLNQVHGKDGLIITSKEQAAGIESFKIDGDFLVANVKHLAVGVLTADCLPIVFFDSVKNVVAIAHAGWRGAVGRIAAKTIESMQKKFGTSLDDIKIFFGPCINLCCYKVANDFGENLGSFGFVKAVMEQNSEGLYFNLAEFNILLLQEFGVNRENISIEYNKCTLCDKDFCSYRRGDKDARQMTVVCLK